MRDTTADVLERIAAAARQTAQHYEDGEARDSFRTFAALLDRAAAIQRKGDA